MTQNRPADRIVICEGTVEDLNRYYAPREFVPTGESFRYCAEAEDRPVDPHLIRDEILKIGKDGVSDIKWEFGTGVSGIYFKLQGFLLKEKK